MEDIAKFELEQLTGLYKFYFDAIVKGIAFFLGIGSFVAKTALDSVQHRRAITLAGMATSILVLVCLIFIAWLERTFREQFRHLAERTSTTPISTAPLRMLIVGTSGLWLVLFAAWIYIFSAAN